ncbi:hypothetical protein Tco_1168772 [Tanacetum coccineum]
MRCKKHYTDLSSINGVCATCLRQRLFILIQQQSQSPPQSLKEEEVEDTTHPTLFPRSVSPYSRTRQHSLPDHRFFSTPQVGPTVAPYSNNDNYKMKKKKSFIKLSLLTNLFRSKKNDFCSDLISDPPATSSTSSPSWFSIKSRRNKQPVMRKQFCPDRGMSPERYSDCDSGYESCQQTPWRTPARRVNSTASGLTFCLSPLVRASPCRNWNHNAAAITTVMTALDGGDVRGAVKPHFCANRSRKLADFGRLNPNR